MKWYYLFLEILKIKIWDVLKIFLVALGVYRSSITTFLTLQHTTPISSWRKMKELQATSLKRSGSMALMNEWNKVTFWQLTFFLSSCHYATFICHLFSAPLFDSHPLVCKVHPVRGRRLRRSSAAVQIHPLNSHIHHPLHQWWAFVLFLLIVTMKMPDMLSNMKCLKALDRNSMQALIMR